jgi:hypothetical protein
MPKKHVTLNQHRLKDDNSAQDSNLGLQAVFHRISLNLAPFQLTASFILAHNSQLCFIAKI